MKLSATARAIAQLQTEKDAAIAAYDLAISKLVALADDAPAAEPKKTRKRKARGLPVAEGL